MREQIIEAMARGIADRQNFRDAQPYMPDAQAALQAIVDAGFAVVPFEPTHDMTGAVLEPCEDRRELVKAYKAMIAEAVKS